MKRLQITHAKFKSIKGAIYLNTIEVRPKKTNLGLAISGSKKNITDRNDVEIGSK